ncbi:decarboxylase [Stenotrophomonas sp. 24(2023)]|uniref:decarboxylase n=1 Tax=Stenotrophomonas sp. 24(2023) TaxID=3068324 RepID=UPI0027DF8B5A|nr:decarboxylase [Stenotrophomonas sp. 24(2023)]WMJ69517.1 decarboxylase [Stenotrophomonas sp. 24(2023)]
MEERLKTAALLALGLLLTTACQAQPPQAPVQAGAWRKVSDAQLERSAQFSMLPAKAAPGSRWAVYDAGKDTVVCCLVVDGPVLDEAALESTYNIPGPWITDLTNGWNLDAAPYRPQVQHAVAKDALAGYRFGDNAGNGGGLLLPANARVAAPRTLEIGGVRYGVERRQHALADDDGTVVTFTLRPAAGGTPLKVEVPYATY